MRALSLLLVLLPLASAQTTGKSHLDFRNEAQAAYERKDYAAALTVTSEALKLRPDSPRYLHNLAALSALTKNPTAAIGYLQRLAALGIATAIERDPDLASLHGTPEFQRVVASLAANREPRGSSETVFELPGRTGIIEGIAYHERTGDLFLSDAHHRCIWRRSREGELTRFTAEDEELAGVFGLKIDAERNTLWAATAAVPEIEGYEPEMKGFAALAEFDLRTGELRHVTPVPDDGREHLLGDLALAPDGTIYATDSRAPVIWHFTSGNEEPQKLIESPALSSLQGIVLQDRTLIVSDYANGLVAIDLGSRQPVALAPPENTTLLGIDGLVSIPGGLVAVQNGTTPQRVLRLHFTPEFNRVTQVEVLASGHPQLTDLALVTLVNDRPTLIADSGWDVFETARSKAPPPHTIRVIQVEIP